MPRNKKCAEKSKKVGKAFYVSLKKKEKRKILKQSSMEKEKKDFWERVSAHLHYFFQCEFSGCTILGTGKVG